MNNEQKYQLLLNALPPFEQKSFLNFYNEVTSTFHIHNKEHQDSLLLLSITFFSHGLLTADLAFDNETNLNLN